LGVCSKKCYNFLNFIGVLVHILTIIFFILFFYATFSTIFHSAETVGEIGKVYGETNLYLFGYLAYIDLLILIYPLYQIYKNKNLENDKDFYVGWMVLVFSLILFQTLIVERSSAGAIGLLFYDSLYPLIGTAGLWLTWILSFSVGSILVFDEIPDFKGIFNKIKERIIFYKNFIFEKVPPLLAQLSEMENPFFDKKSTESMITIVRQRRMRKRGYSKLLRTKVAKKVIDESKKKRPAVNEDEVVMLEERPIEDIVNIEIAPMSSEKSTKVSKKRKSIKKAVKKEPIENSYFVVENSIELGEESEIGDLDKLYEEAKEIVLKEQKTSISYLQRKLKIGYKRSSNIIKQLQYKGVLSAPNNKGQREIIL